MYRTRALDDRKRKKERENKEGKKTYTDVTSHCRVDIPLRGAKEIVREGGKEKKKEIPLLFSFSLRSRTVILICAQFLDALFSRRRGDDEGR